MYGPFCNIAGVHPSGTLADTKLDVIPAISAQIRRYKILMGLYLVEPLFLLAPRQSGRQCYDKQHFV